MKPTDDERLRHMRDAAQEAMDLLAARAAADIAHDRAVALALVKLIEIVGEAATNVSSHRRKELSDIPWQEVMATRNRLIHGYYDVNVAIVVATVREDLPRLIESIDRALQR